MNKLMSIIIRSDSYKASQWKQYPSGTQAVSSYIEAREGSRESVFFGLQAFIKEYLLDPITMEDIDKAEKIITAHGEPFNREGWVHIVNAFGGYLPIRIEAVPEGTVMPTSNVQVQIVNTDPKSYWLTSYVETALLRGVWYPSTVATKSREMKLEIAQALKETSDIPVEDQINFKLHDFGARGASSGETAMLGGMGHLVNFMGTDTMEALVGVMEYYGAEGPVGFSIPASEHSTITSWGQDREEDAYKNIVELFSGDGKIYACVSDSYDIYTAVEKIWGENLKEKVIESGGTLVVRPDSGDPLTVPVEVIELLMEKFGYTINSKGFKVLPDCIRVIQGDGITTETLPIILDNLIEAGISIDNIAFGMGGGLLQKVDRDTLKYAMKASAIMDEDGVWHDVFKDPIHGGKTSKRGRLRLIQNYDKFCTVTEKAGGGMKNYLVPVFENGELLRDYTFDEIRRRANQ